MIKSEIKIIQAGVRRVISANKGEKAEPTEPYIRMFQAISNLKKVTTREKIYYSLALYRTANKYKVIPAYVFREMVNKEDNDMTIRVFISLQRKGFIKYKYDKKNDSFIILFTKHTFKEIASKTHLELEKEWKQDTESKPDNFVDIPYSIIHDKNMVDGKCRLRWNDIVSASLLFGFYKSNKIFNKKKKYNEEDFSDIVDESEAKYYLNQGISVFIRTGVYPSNKYIGKLFGIYQQTPTAIVARLKHIGFLSYQIERTIEEENKCTRWITLRYEYYSNQYRLCVTKMMSARNRQNNKEEEASMKRKQKIKKQPVTVIEKPGEPTEPTEQDFVVRNGKTAKVVMGTVDEIIRDNEKSKSNSWRDFDEKVAKAQTRKKRKQEQEEVMDKIKLENPELANELAKRKRRKPIFSGGTYYQ